MGAGFPADDVAFFRQVDLNIQVFQNHVILEIPIPPVGLLCQHHAAFAVLGQKCDHVAELFAACNLRRLRINEFADDLESLFGCVFAQQYLLRRN